MATPRIPPQFIDSLISKVDIIDVIDSYVPLKKAGKDYQACCPFHNEKTPSFTVSQQKQFFHCFGCGANGSAISFLMDYLQIGFIDAIEELASRAGVELPKTIENSNNHQHSTTKLYELMELVIKFYSKKLYTQNKSNHAIDYLKNRGISENIIKEYELGFAPLGWDNLIKELGSSKKSMQNLIKIGAVIKNEKEKCYDRFNGRIIFPIRDQRGRAIGMGGRVLDEKSPKYMNSPETAIFHKGNEFYGLHQAKKNLKDNDHVFVVEGYMDVIALAQYKINNVVACLGTAITPAQITKLFRLTKIIVFCFDGDLAGEKAAWKAMENSLPLLQDDKHVFFIFLPKNEDPDSFVRSNGKDIFLKQDIRVSLSDFLFDSLKKQIKLDIPEEKAGFAKSILPYISKLKTNAPVLFSILLDKLYKLTDINADDLKNQLKLLHVKNDALKKSPAPIKNKIKNNNNLLLTLSIKLLLRKPELALDKSINKLLDKIKIDGIEFLADLIKYIQQNPKATYASIIEHYRDREKIKNRLLELSPYITSYEIDDKHDFLDKILKDQFLGILNKLVILTDRALFKNLANIDSTKKLSEEQKQKLLLMVEKKR